MYDSAKKKIGDGTIDLDTHTFKIALFLSTSNCNDLTHDEYADLTNEHANNNGYTTGGVALTGVTWTTSTSTTTWDANNPTWTAASGSIIAMWGVIYDDSVAGDPLVAVCYLDYNSGAPANVTTTDGNTFTFTMHADGILRATGATSDT